jgi:hypothetical protein
MGESGKALNRDEFFGFFQKRTAVFALACVVDRALYK